MHMYAIEIMSKNGGSVKPRLQNRLKSSIFNGKVTLDLYPNEIAVVYDYFNVHLRQRNFWNEDFTIMYYEVKNYSILYDLCCNNSTRTARLKNKNVFIEVDHTKGFDL